MELSNINIDTLNDEVSEIFCKDSFTSRAREFGLTHRFAFDISEGWDLNPESRRRALTVQEETEPFIVVGSPRCTAWSSLLNFGKQIPKCSMT